MGYQMSLFDIINNRQEFKIDKQIRLIELFAGYGSQHFALEYLGANFERIAVNQSNASLYHLAGDSIVVDVLMYIFKQMLETKEE